MIYVTLMGGLGNQMFQYAFASSLAARSGLKLLLSLAYLEDRRHRTGFAMREYGLSAFSIKSETISRDPYYLFSPGLLNKVEKRIRGGRRIRELGLAFDPKLMLVRDGFVYEGNFQSERYFADRRIQIIEELRPVIPLSPVSQVLASKAETTESVSIHIRRGDYLSNRQFTEHFGVCGGGYYKAAIAELRRSIASPVFFLFSDDIAWVRKNLAVEGECHYVDHNRGSSSWEDLVLMSRCKHNIVANSSFSWWGAWLNDNPGRTVIAPVPWFAGEKDTQDLVPPAWLRQPACFEEE